MTKIFMLTLREQSMFPELLSEEVVDSYDGGRRATVGIKTGQD
jgi:hypothetical protein